VLAGTWPIYAYFSVDNAARLWKVEYADRFSGDLSDRAEPFWYYLPLLFALLAPYMLSLPEAIATPFIARYRVWRTQLAFALTWGVVGTLVISCGAYKRPHYLLSMVPAFCLLLTPVIDRLFFGDLTVPSRPVRAVSRIMPVALAIGAVVGGVLVHQEYPAALGTYAVLAGVIVTLWTVATLVFARGRRTLSFALLNLGIAAGVTVGWPEAGAVQANNPECDALTAQLRSHGVKENDPIYWVDGRPNSYIEFYSGYRVRRLINELEMTEVRQDRRTLSDELFQMAGGRIRQRLAEPRPVYLVMAGWQYDMMRRHMKIPARVLFELSGFHHKPGDDLVVITQPEMGSTAVSRPAPPLTTAP
jgi:hypothetical protein